MNWKTISVSELEEGDVVRSAGYPWINVSIVDAIGEDLWVSPIGDEFVRVCVRNPHELTDEEWAARGYEDGGDDWTDDELEDWDSEEKYLDGDLQVEVLIR